MGIERRTDVDRRAAAAGVDGQVTSGVRAASHGHGTRRERGREGENES